MTALEQDVAAAVTTHHHTSRHGGVIRLESQVLENEVPDVHQGHRTVNVSTVVDAVIHDDDAVHVVTLEGDGIGCRLPDVVLVEVEAGVGAGPQMEHGRTSKSTEIQGFLDGRHIREVRIRATHGIIALQQAIAGVGGDLNGIVGMETIRLTVTGGHINRHVVVAVARGKGTERERGRNVEADVARPVERGGLLGNHPCLVAHLNLERTGGHLVGSGGVGRIASVGEEDAHILRLIGNQTVRHGIQTVEPHIVVMDIGVVVVSHQESVETGLATVSIFHVDMIVDSISVTDGRQFPLGIHRMDGVVTGIGVSRRSYIVGESVGIGNNDGRTAVNLIAEHHRTQVNRVVIRKFCFNRVRTKVVRKGVAGVIIERRLHQDTRRDELAVGETETEIVHEPTCASFCARSWWGCLVQTDLETKMSGSGSTRFHKDGS